MALLRRSAGLTQEQFAERTGYSVDFIGLVERGINSPAVERLEGLADVLGVEVMDLFDFKAITSGLAPQEKVLGRRLRPERKKSKSSAKKRNL